MEREWIEGEFRPCVEPVLINVSRKLTIIIKHIPGQPLKIRLRRRETGHQEVQSPMVEPEDTPITPVITNNSYVTPDAPSIRHVENPTQGLRVTFPDGTVIAESKAVITFVKTLQCVGLQRVHELGIKHKSYNLVDGRQRPGGSWQHRCGNWFIYTKLSNEAKKGDLRKVSDALNLNLHIEDNFLRSF